MSTIISESQFNAKVLEYLRIVEEKQETLIITHRGKPMVKIIPYNKEEKGRMVLKNK